MTNANFLNLQGEKIEVDGLKLTELNNRLEGSLFTADNKAYDESRSIWNGMIERKPSLIIKCHSTGDIQKAVNFAGEYNLLTSIRGGGHHIAGNAVCENGLMIDLSSMNKVTIDNEKKKAKVGPGATLADFDAAAQAHGLATPLGINSTTGVAGLTLGGGFGWLSRKYGMTVDNLLGVEIVTADGNLLQANENENQDLFWAVRGGGGNFGIVTQFEYKLHNVGPEVYSGLVVYSLEDGVSVLKQYNQFTENLGDETSVWAVLRQAPPLPFLPESVHGKEIIALACFHSGDPDEGQKAIEPARQFGKVLGEHLGAQPYTAWQQAFDPLLTPGARNYWKSHNFAKLSDGAIDVAVKNAARLPTNQCEIFFGQIGAATNRVAPTATAYPHRDANFVMNVHGRWDSTDDDENGIAWARDVFEQMTPYATGGAYINFLTGDEADRVKAGFGVNYDRLAKIKAKYDPKNIFRLNQNILPA